MYVGPVVKTYYSSATYQQDSALMAYYGYQAINIETHNATNGLLLTLLLIFGLLLTPVCIGIVILCFLPFAFSKYWTVTYIQQSALPRPPAPPQAVPSSQPPLVPGAFPHLPIPQPSAYAAPAMRPGQATVQPIQQVPLGVRVQVQIREAWASVKQEWHTWKPWQQRASIAALALILLVGILGPISIFTALAHPSHEVVRTAETPTPNDLATTAVPTPVPTQIPTSAPVASNPPPGIWCPVIQGQMPTQSSACEIYPSDPQLSYPPQAEPVLAGTLVGPQIGNGGPDSVTEDMNNPWAADVICNTNDGTYNGSVQIVMVAHTNSGDYYSWGNESCVPGLAPYYGHEFFRKASVSVTLSISPVSGNLADWSAQLIKL